MSNKDKIKKILDEGGMITLKKGSYIVTLDNVRKYIKVEINKNFDLIEEYTCDNSQDSIEALANKYKMYSIFDI